MVQDEIRSSTDYEFSICDMDLLDAINFNTSHNNASNAIAGMMVYHSQLFKL